MNSHDLAELLTTAHDLRVVRVTHLTGSRAVLAVEWANGNAAFTVDIVEVLDSNHSAGRAIQSAPKLARAVQGAPEHLTEAQARKRGLPLWWSAEWLTGQLDRLGTFRAVAEAAGVSEQVVSEWGRRHGISRKPRVSKRTTAEAVESLASDLREGREWGPVRADAERWSVSEATVSRWRKAARATVEAEQESK